MRSRWSVWVVLAAAGWTSCATQRTSPGSSPDDVEAADTELKRLEVELGALAVGAPADCDRTRSLTRNICELAERICTLATRRPEDARIDALCRDDRERCERARTQAGARCGPER